MGGGRAVSDRVRVLRYVSGVLHFVVTMLSNGMFLVLDY